MAVRTDLKLQTVEEQLLYRILQFVSGETPMAFTGETRAVTEILLKELLNVFTSGAWPPASTCPSSPIQLTIQEAQDLRSALNVVEGQAYRIVDTVGSFNRDAGFPLFSFLTVGVLNIESGNVEFSESGYGWLYDVENGSVLQGYPAKIGYDVIEDAYYSVEIGFSNFKYSISKEVSAFVYPYKFYKWANVRDSRNSTLEGVTLGSYRSVFTNSYLRSLALNFPEDLAAVVDLTTLINIPELRFDTTPTSFSSVNVCLINTDLSGNAIRFNRADVVFNSIASIQSSIQQVNSSDVINATLLNQPGVSFQTDGQGIIRLMTPFGSEQVYDIDLDDPGVYDALTETLTIDGSLYPNSAGRFSLNSSTAIVAQRISTINYTGRRDTVIVLRINSVIGIKFTSGGNLTFDNTTGTIDPPRFTSVSIRSLSLTTFEIKPVYQF